MPPDLEKEKKKKGRKKGTQRIGKAGSLMDI